MGAPQARLLDLGRRLQGMGHEVRVLTAMPNYPTGKLFSGYRGLYLKEIRDGIPVHRSWILPSNRPSLLHRLASYLSFALSSMAIGFLRIGKADVILTESPPLFLAAAGWLLARLKGAQWIMNVSDLWPDSAKFIGMMQTDSTAYRLLKSLAHFLYRKAWLVTGQSREIVAEIKRQVPIANAYHLSNGVDTHRFHPEKRSQGIRLRYAWEGETVFVFAGLHGLFQGLDQILIAAERLRDFPLRFVFIGDGPEKESLIRTARGKKLQNVGFHPPLPHDEMPAILASMDVGLITLKSEIRGAVPSKIYEAMASGIPVLLVAKGESVRIVQGAGCGLTVSPGDIDGLVQATLQMASDAAARKAMGRAGRRVAEIQYDRLEITQKFEVVIRQQPSASRTNS